MAQFLHLGHRHQGPYDLRQHCRGGDGSSAYCLCVAVNPPIGQAPCQSSVGQCSSRQLSSGVSCHYGAGAGGMLNYNVSHHRKLSHFQQNLTVDAISVPFTSSQPSNTGGPSTVETRGSPHSHPPKPPREPPGAEEGVCGADRPPARSKAALLYPWRVSFLLPGFQLSQACWS